MQTQTALVEQLQENQRKQAQLLQIRGDIARDLHDELGSELSGISILSQVAIGRLAHQPAQAQTALTTIGETARHIMDRMRDIVWSLTLHQPQTDAVANRLRSMAGSVFEHTGIRPVLEFSAQVPVPTLPPDQWRNLSLIYKEALHNIVKHARATEVTIRLAAEDLHTLCLMIHDNGIGFSPDALPTGHGLRNQHHRATALGGTIHIDSKPGVWHHGNPSVSGSIRQPRRNALPLRQSRAKASVTEWTFHKTHPFPCSKISPTSKSTPKFP